VDRPGAALARIRRGLTARLDSAEEADAEGTTDASGLVEAYADLRHEVIRVRNEELRRLYDAHEISDTTRRRLQNDLDLEEAGLGEYGSL